MNKTNQTLDIIISKVVSRKLMVWIVATFALFADKIDGTEWMFISLMYVFIQGIADLKELYKIYKQ